MEKGFNNGPQNKVQEYINRYKAGESLESFGDIPESWKNQILQSSESKEFTNELHNAKSLEEIKNVLDELGKDNYIFTHITQDNVAENIYNSNFRYSLGTGLTGTMSFTGSSGAINQIEKILSGESPHRDLSGMFVTAIPKSLFPKNSEDFKVSADTIEDYLIDNHYGNTANGDMEIPKEFNFGYLKDGVLHYKK